MEIDWSPRRRDWPDAPLQQDWDWGEALRAVGTEVRRARLGRHGWAQVLVRRIGPLRLSLVSRGPVWTPGAARGPALTALRRALGGVLIVTPDGAAEAGRGLALFTPSHVAEIALRGDLRAGMAGKWRNRLCHAERAGLRIETGGDAAWLVPLERAQGAARGYRPYPPELALAHAGRRLFTVWRERERLAAMLFLRHGARATYQIGWSGEEGRRVAAHNLCLWAAMTALCEDGARLLDLGTVDTDRAPGLARFKIGAGARVRPLGPTVWVLR